MGHIAVACALLLLLPAGALAQDRSVSFESERFRTGGYEVALTAESDGRGDRSKDVALVVGRGDREQGHGDRIRSFYIPLRRGRTQVTPSRIHSRLGRRGSVGLRFRPRTRTVKRFGCVRMVVNRGVLAGHLRFRGEAGYVKVLEHRIKARRVRFRTSGCAGQASHDTAGPVPVILLACRSRSAFGVRQLPRGRTDFVALGPSGFNRGLYRGTLAILQGDEEQFRHSGDLTAATVDPPRPFRGIGTFSDEGGGELGGTLRASFFSTKRIRFAPAPAVLVRARQADCTEPPLERRPRAAAARAAALRLLGAGWLAGSGRP